MLLTKEIEITLHSRYIKHLTGLGYSLYNRPDRDGNMTVPKGSKFRIKVNDLMPHSSKFIKVKCDYCGKEFEKRYCKYLHERSIIAKDCCKDCDKLKRLEVEKLKYGDNYRSAYDIPGVGERIRAKRRKYNIEKIRDEFRERDLELLSNEFVSVDHYLKFTCLRHPELGIQSVKYANFKNNKGGCKSGRYDKVRAENAYQWKNGITPLQNYVRDKMGKWKYASFDNCNRQCLITWYKKSLVIHHFNKNFNEILEETLSYLRLPIHNNISGYEAEQLKIIVDTCLEFHYKYGYGIALRKEIHELFHNIYGRKGNTNEQFIEFKERYYNGEFDKKLPEKLSSKNSLQRLSKGKYFIDLTLCWFYYLQGVFVL